MEIWTGFIIGIVGSFHCIGMCGPIALALPQKGDSNYQIFFYRGLYNIGRILTYSLMGALFGLFGEKIMVSGFQQYLSISLGVIILVVFMLPRRIKSKIADSRYLKELTSFFRRGFNKIIQLPAHFSFLFIGILNGFLPCGLVYIALAGAMSTGGIISGLLFMALFGFGTFPVMFAATIAGRYINSTIRGKLNKLIPYFAVILALIFIFRGLNLGIPILSPRLSSPSSQHLMHGH